MSEISLSSESLVTGAVSTVKQRDQCVRWKLGCRVSFDSKTVRSVEVGLQGQSGL